MTLMEVCNSQIIVHVLHFDKLFPIIGFDVVLGILLGFIFGII